jgi:predicted PurR-regulated permease PerM
MAAFFLLTFAAILLCALVLQPFLAGVVFAVTIAVCTQAPYRWLSARIRNPSLCATVALLILLIAGIAPLVLIGWQLSRQASSLIDAIRSGAPNLWLQHFVTQHPAIASQLQKGADLFDLNTILQSAAGWSGKHLVTLIGNSASLLIQLIVMHFVLFFLWRDDRAAINLLRSLLPIHTHDANELIQRLHDTVYAAGFGRLAIAALQGVLAGLAYWILGVPGAGFWGFVTGLFAIIPGFGAVLVWAPIALYLALSDSWVKALILAVWGGGFVSLIDNFLYPLLVGPGLRMHTAIIFLSLLGGVALFGAPGIILGPLAFTFAASLLDIWRNRQQSAL